MGNLPYCIPGIEGAGTYAGALPDYFLPVVFIAYVLEPEGVGAALIGPDLVNFAARAVEYAGAVLEFPEAVRVLVNIGIFPDKIFFYNVQVCGYVSNFLQV